MRRISRSALGVAALLGVFLTADIVEAQRPRNPVDRRLRPGSGFWQNTPSSSSNRSFSTNRVIPQQSVISRGTSNLQPYTPQTYAAPNRVYNSQPVVRYQNALPSRSTVRAATPEVNSGRVVSPVATRPTVTVQRYSNGRWVGNCYVQAPVVAVPNQEMSASQGTASNATANANAGSRSGETPTRGTEEKLTSQSKAESAK